MHSIFKDCPLEKQPEKQPKIKNNKV